MSKKMGVPVVLGPWATGYGSWLAARGYAPLTVTRKLRGLARFSRWLEREGLSASDLTPACAEFVRAQRSAGCKTLVSPRNLKVPLEYLREVEAVPLPGSPVGNGPVEELVAAMPTEAVSVQPGFRA